MSKMQSFIAQNKKIFVGLEDSKKTWKVAVRSEKMLIHEASMNSDYGSLKGYFANKFPGCTIKVIYEAGFHGFWLHDLLVKDGIVCIVVPPHTVTEEKTSKVKTDKRDARRLAQNLENDDYKSCFVPDRERRDDRQISRTLEDVHIDIVRTRNRIWKMLDFHGIATQIGSRIPNKQDICNLRKLAVSDKIATALNVYIDQLEFLWKQQTSLRNQLRAMTKKERYKKTWEIIHSVPGIGWFTAIRLVLEWGEDLSRFANKRKIASFVGLTGKEYSTGETVRKGSLTGLGHKRCRTWLIECVWIALRHDPVLKDKFLAIARNTGSKKKAIVAVARKLVGRILYCVTNNQPYVVGLIAAGNEPA